MNESTKVSIAEMKRDLIYRISRKALSAIQDGLIMTADEFMATNPTPNEVVSAVELKVQITKQQFMSTRPNLGAVAQRAVKAGIPLTVEDYQSICPIAAQRSKAAVAKFIEQSLPHECSL